MNANPPILVRQIAVGPMANFAYLLGSRATGEAAVIDPGWDADKIVAEATALSLTITKVLLTHAHYDHVDALSELLKHVEADVYVHDIDWIWTHHETGYSAFDAVSAKFEHERLWANWARYANGKEPDRDASAGFFGFVDFAIFRTEFLRTIAGDLKTMLRVWHEIAIPSAILYRTTRIGVSNGLALWGRIGISRSRT